MRDEQAHPFEIATRQLPSPLIIGLQTAQNWCRDNATEIGRKISKTTRDVKIFDVL